MFQLKIDNDLQVRSLHLDDAEEFFDLIERNRSRLLPWIHPSALPVTLPQTRSYIIESFFYSQGDLDEAMGVKGESFWELDPYIPPPVKSLEMGIWYRDFLAGMLLLERLPEDDSTAEFGYWLDRAMEGQGIVSRCVASLMDYALENLETERFLIGCAVDNLRSRAIPERLGFRLQAMVPRGEVVGEIVYDRAIYVMNAREWTERKQEMARSV